MKYIKLLILFSLLNMNAVKVYEYEPNSGSFTVYSKRDGLLYPRSSCSIRVDYTDMDIVNTLSDPLCIFTQFISDDICKAGICASNFDSIRNFSKIMNVNSVAWIINDTFLYNDGSNSYDEMGAVNSMLGLIGWYMQYDDMPDLVLFKQSHIRPGSAIPRNIKQDLKDMLVDFHIISEDKIYL